MGKLGLDPLVLCVRAFDGVAAVEDVVLPLRQKLALVVSEHGMHRVGACREGTEAFALCHCNPHSCRLADSVVVQIVGECWHGGLSSVAARLPGRRRRPL